MIGIPTTSVNSGHGIPAHHTSFDTPAQVDPKSLRDLAVMNAAYSYFLASAGTEQMHWMAELAVERGYDQINSGTANSLDLVAAAKDADSLSHLLYWEKARVDYNLAIFSRSWPVLPPLPLRRNCGSKAPSRSAQRNCIWERYSRWPPTSVPKPKRSSCDASEWAPSHWMRFRRVSGKAFPTAASGRQLWQHSTGVMANAT